MLINEFLLIIGTISICVGQQQQQQQKQQQQQQQEQQKPKQKVTTYTFPEFPYKETNKNEIMFREVETACERGCLGKNGLSKITCIRQCVSPSCYRDLYQNDQLEEGEVDVRLNSFKGCFIQRYNKSRP